MAIRLSEIQPKTMLLSDVMSQRPDTSERMAAIEARQMEVLKSYPSLFDSPYTGPGADVGAIVDDYGNRSGLGRSDLLTIAGNIDTKDPRFAEKFENQAKGRRYQGFFDELGRAYGKFKLEAGSAMVGAFAKLGEMAQGIPSPYRGATMSAGVNFEVEKEAAVSLWEEAQGFEYQPGQGGGVPAFVAQVAGNVVPYVGLTLAGGLVAGPIGAFGSAALIEGNGGYREALADGESEEVAMVNGAIRGSAVGLLEMLQLGEMVKFGRGATAAVQKTFSRKVADSTAKKIAKSAVVIGSKQVKTALEESFVEVLQEWAGDGTAFLVYGKKPQDMAYRTSMSAAGGFVGALLMGPAFIVINGQTPQTKTEPGRQTPYEGEAGADRVPVQSMDEFAEKMRAGENPLPPMVMSEEEYAQFQQLEAEQAESTAGVQDTTQASGAGEVAPDLAARSQEAEAGSGQAQDLWRRLTTEQEFAAADDAEADLKDAYDAGIIENPADVDEWMKPGTTPTALNDPAVRAPSARTTSARQADLLTFLHEIGRESINSHERQAWEQAMQSPRAIEAMKYPDIYVRKVIERGELLHSEEEVGLTMHLAKLRNELESIKEDSARLKEQVGDDGLDAETDRVENEIERVANALDLGGTDIGRALQIRRMLLNEKLEIEYVKRRAKKKKGQDLTPEDNARFEKMVAEHARMTDEIAALRAQLDAAEAERSAKQSGKRRKAQPKTTREQRLANNMAKLKEMLEAGC